MTSLLKILQWFPVSIRVKANHSIIISSALCHLHKVLHHTSRSPLISFSTSPTLFLLHWSPCFSVDKPSIPCLRILALVLLIWHISFPYFHMAHPSFSSCLSENFTFSNTCKIISFFPLLTWQSLIP